MIQYYKVMYYSINASFLSVSLHISYGFAFSYDSSKT